MQRVEETNERESHLADERVSKRIRKGTPAKHSKWNPLVLWQRRKTRSNTAVRTYDEAHHVPPQASPSPLESPSTAPKGKTPRSPTNVAQTGVGPVQRTISEHGRRNTKALRYGSSNESDASSSADRSSTKSSFSFSTEPSSVMPSERSEASKVYKASEPESEQSRSGRVKEPAVLDRLPRSAIIGAPKLEHVNRKMIPEPRSRSPTSIDEQREISMNTAQRNRSIGAKEALARARAERKFETAREAFEKAGGRRRFERVREEERRREAIEWTRTHSGAPSKAERTLSHPVLHARSHLKDREDGFLNEAIRDAQRRGNNTTTGRIGNFFELPRAHGEFTKEKDDDRIDPGHPKNTANLEVPILKADAARLKASSVLGMISTTQQNPIVKRKLEVDTTLSETDESRQDESNSSALVPVATNHAMFTVKNTARRLSKSNQQSSTDNAENEIQGKAARDNSTIENHNVNAASQPPAPTVKSPEPQRNVPHEEDNQIHVLRTVDTPRKLQSSGRSSVDRVYRLANAGVTLIQYLIGNQEPPLEPGKERIRWTCRCGALLWDDFQELRAGAAEDLRRNLDFFQQNSNMQSSEGFSQYADNASDGSSSGEPLELSTFENPSNTLTVRNMQDANGINASRDNTTRLGSQHRKTSEYDKKFLLLCISRKHDTLRLKQLNIENVRSDFQLFNLLKGIYLSHQGTMSRFVSLRKLASVNFRKIERHPRERVVLLSAKDILPQRYNPNACHRDHLSPKCDTAYDIDPSPPDLEPYVGRNGLEHLLNHPHEAEEEGNNLPLQQVWLKRFPKKEKTKLTVCPPYQYGLGWGIELEEEWNMSWMMKAITSSLVLAATLFLIVWWKLRGDVQGATGMAAFLVSCGTLLMAYFSAVSLV